MIGELFVNDFGNTFSIYNGNIEMEINFYMPFPKTAFKWASGKKAEMLKDTYELKEHNQKPDLDNLTKTILDSLNGIAYEDDSCISKLTINKVWSREPKTIVTIDYTDIKDKKDMVNFDEKQLEKESQEIELITTAYEERKKK